MSEHSVVVYTNENVRPRTFTATARKASARLDEVNKWCKQNGYGTSIVVAKNLSKAQATLIKAQQIRAYESNGYRYQPRPPL